MIRQCLIRAVPSAFVMIAFAASPAIFARDSGNSGGQDGDTFFCGGFDCMPITMCSSATCVAAVSTNVKGQCEAYGGLSTTKVQASVCVPKKGQKLKCFNKKLTGPVTCSATAYYLCNQGEPKGGTIVGCIEYCDCSGTSSGMGSLIINASCWQQSP